MEVETREERLRKKRERKELSDRHAAEIMRPEFIEKVVHPIAREGFPEIGSLSDCTALIIRNKGAGQITIRYDFGADASIYGKHYTGDLGRLSFELMQAFWQDGFGQDRPYQVAEPLAFLPEHNLVFQKGAPGAATKSILKNDQRELIDHVRKTARWLIQMHRSPLRMGEPVNRWDSSVMSIAADRLTSAVAYAPSERNRLIDMFNACCRLGANGAGNSPVVQTHGEFYFPHVFVNGATTTVIDLDTTLPADPARDLAEYVWRMRLKTFKWTGGAERADAPTNAFLEEYFSHLPEHAGNLAFHWGGRVLARMFGFMKSYEDDYENGSETDRAEFKGQMEFFKSEFDCLLASKWAQG